jgi:putative N-acetylmannosamine-6-phosphate epimerase/predicted NBD/HSP70 family sugar kinase
MTTLDSFLKQLRAAPLVASVQASEGSPIDDPETLLRLANASRQEGVQILRLQGVENIALIRGSTAAMTIGLIKRTYPDSEVYITPTSTEVRELVNLECDVIALDATQRPRPKGASLKELIELIHGAGAIAMADCDSLDSARYAIECGADLVGTTLAGYTKDRATTHGPDLDLLRDLVWLGKPVIAEGRYSERWQVEAALRIGATAVVVGGALNDPVKQTKALSPHKKPTGNVGAVDIGGTWLRFGLFTPDWQLEATERTPNPPKREDRLGWIRETAAKHQVEEIGVSTGGIIDPATGICWAAKEYLMPDQIGIEFSERTLGLRTYAHGDGHATAWGHVCLPQFAGRRVATLALGTGVGCGFVQDGRIWAGRRGEYPRINDLPTSGGATYEDLLGGIHLTKEPTDDQKQIAVQALEDALFAVRNLYFPDDVIVAGSVGLSDWMRPHLDRLETHPSPFGTDAGLYGAAALALFPPTT